MPTAPLFFKSRWSAYTWPNYGPRYDTSKFTAFTITAPTTTTALVSIMPQLTGQWQVIYSRRPGAYDQSSQSVPCTLNVGTNVTLKNLQPGQTYYARVVLNGVNPNTPQGLPISGSFMSDEQSFSTPLTNVGPPPVISNVVATTGQPIANRTTVTWTTDIAGDSTLNYGLTTAMGTTITDATSVTAHSLQTNAVNSGNTYFYTVTTKTPAGGTATSAQGQFTMP